VLLTSIHRWDEPANAGATRALIALTKAYGATLAVDRVDLNIEADTYCCLPAWQNLDMAQDRGP